MPYRANQDLPSALRNHLPEQRRRFTGRRSIMPIRLTQTIRVVKKPRTALLGLRSNAAT